MIMFLTILLLLLSAFLVLIVLVQRGRGGGLAGAFGSGGGSTSAFGTKTGDVFTTVTVVLFVVFMLLAIWLNMHFSDVKPPAMEGVKTTVASRPSNPEPAPLPTIPAMPSPAT